MDSINQRMEFHRFYEIWFDQLQTLVHQFTQAPKPPSTQEHRIYHTQLVHKVISHFSDYYRVKFQAAKTEVLSIFAAQWCTSLERSLHWIAGWRPTTAFHLLYTESSILFESNIEDILNGIRTGDLGDLTPRQFSRISELQCQTVQEENSITDELSDWQDGSSDVEGKYFDLNEKMEGLVSIVQKAKIEDVKKGCGTADASTVSRIYDRSVRVTYRDPWMGIRP